MKKSELKQIIRECLEEGGGTRRKKRIDTIVDNPKWRVIGPKDVDQSLTSGGEENIRYRAGMAKDYPKTRELGHSTIYAIQRGTRTPPDSPETSLRAREFSKKHPSRHVGRGRLPK